MTVLRTKYPIKVGDRLYPANTDVVIMPVSDPRVQEVWPGMTYAYGSTQVAVLFPERTMVTIIHKDQIRS